jgi:hypothetical protein
MFRPWSQDPRPVWRVQARWMTTVSVDAVEHELLTALTDTGQVRVPSLEADSDGLTVTMLVRADSREAAAYAAARIADVTCRLAGLGHLGSVSIRAARPVTRDTVGAGRGRAPASRGARISRSGQ